MSESMLESSAAEIDLAKRHEFEEQALHLDLEEMRNESAIQQYCDTDGKVTTWDYIREEQYGKDISHEIYNCRHCGTTEKKR